MLKENRNKVLLRDTRVYVLSMEDSINHHQKPELLVEGKVETATLEINNDDCSGSSVVIISGVSRQEEGANDTRAIQSTVDENIHMMCVEHQEASVEDKTFFHHSTETAADELMDDDDADADAADKLMDAGVDEEDEVLVHQPSGAGRGRGDDGVLMASNGQNMPMKANPQTDLANGPNSTHHREELGVTEEHVSDMSSDDDDDNGDDVGIIAGGDEIENEFGTVNHDGHLPRNRSFTICSVITSNSEQNGSDIRSQRENVDRLLLSGTMSAGGASSVAGSDRSGTRQCMSMERNATPSSYAYQYDQSYYKSGDWLRFVPRRTSVGNMERARSSNTSGSNESHTLSMAQSLPNDNPTLGVAGGGYVHGGSPGYGNTGGDNLNPDLYYRGFDNTRIRTGFGSSYRYGGGQSRMRAYLGSQPQRNQMVSGTHQNHHIGPNGEILGGPTTAGGDINNFEQGMGEVYQGPNYARTGQQYHHSSAPPGRNHPHSHGMYPNNIPAPIDEEEGGGENNFDGGRSMSPPLEIHCSTPDLSDSHHNEVENNLAHGYSGDEIQQHQLLTDVGEGQSDLSDSHQNEVEANHTHGYSGDPADVVGGQYNPSDVPPDQGVVTRQSSPPPNSLASPSAQSPSPPPEATMQFQTSLRVGGIIVPNVSTHSHQNTMSPEMQELRMHEASWDSKFEMYACRVDQRQEDRSVEIPIFSTSRPHMRAFHYAWLAFFFTFLAWFAITPLLGEVQDSLGLTKEEIWASNIASVAGAVFTRCICGLFCDIYGARWISAAVLFITGVPTIFTGAVNSATGLIMLRLVTGIGGSAFVTCQYWTCTMFTKEVAGTANALAAGWGNLGGGVAQIFVGTMLFPFFKWIYTAAETQKDPAELSWRTCCVIPGLLCTCFTFYVLRYSDDSPKGNYCKRKKLSLMERPSAMKHIKAAIRDHNTWVLLIQYGCCFGVELTTTNAAALYFQEEFELSTPAAAAVASTFGWMNLFARGLGGFLSDISNAYRGMRGRLCWQWVCFILEGKWHKALKANEF